MANKIVLGIDVGGSGIKGAPVNIKTGKLLAERFRIPTPEGRMPDDMINIIAEIVKHFKWSGPIGCGFPAAVQNGKALTAANIDITWIGKNIATLIKTKTKCNAVIINDADAAGLAEFRFGAGKNTDGIVIIVTVGTGLGTAIFHNGQLLPNTELGHIMIKGKDAERYASDGTRQLKGLSWERWARRFNRYLNVLESLFWPKLIIIGGGVSKKPEKYIQYINTKTRVLPAKLLNEAGIIGAALSAEKLL